ncbi:hypothetical protein fh0823_18780 [Francisella halioticida]|uniref:Cysteine dioxygenase n=1 Tax=Francisella halioticida TaxID=549298 RepID=A0ABN5AY23_9GAMM|nr:hypothetical protein [Francisella halioticida]ASG68773.1 hypothetical protein CDV26_10635 [Francisella halioticida]BCD91739.1 hypothetical protein fh0823_18780 [Francisella halioticida]
MLNQITEITTPFISKIEKSQCLEEKKEVVKEMLLKLYKTKDTWFNLSFFRKNIDDDRFYILPIHLNAKDEHCLSIQAWGAHYTTPIHNHDTWSSSITIQGLETQYLYGSIAKPYPSKHKLPKAKPMLFNEGTTIELDRNELHQVENHTNDIAISIVFFMKHPDTTDRIKVNLENNNVTYWKDNPKILD